MAGLASRLLQYVPVPVKRRIRRLGSPKVARRSTSERVAELDVDRLRRVHDVARVHVVDEAGSAEGQVGSRLVVCTSSAASLPATRHEGDLVTSLAALRLPDAVTAHGWDTPLELAPVDRDGPYNFKILYPGLNVLFTEVPKNASSTIKATLLSIEQEGRVNRDYARYTHHPAWQAAFPDHRVRWGDLDWQGRFRFAFLRNPFDRVASVWRNAGWKDHFGDLTFPEFVDRLPDLLDAPLDDHVAIHCKPFSTFVPRVGNGYYLDFIGRFEDFATDFRTVLEAVGITDVPELPVLNRSGDASYRDHYDDRSRAVVAGLYEEDIALGQYSF